jgi:hypothetical protein
VITTEEQFSQRKKSGLQDETGCILDQLQEHNSGIKKVILLHSMEAHGGRRCCSYSFLTSALDGGEWSASCHSCALPLGKGTPVLIAQEAGWAPESVCPCRESNPDRPACSQTHFWYKLSVIKCLYSFKQHYMRMLFTVSSFAVVNFLC